jgi:pyridoxamine 5'-phosphate oxidase
MSFSDNNKLSDNAVTSDPLSWFDAWFERAESTGMDYPNAATLSTVGPEGQPSSRIVLIKDYGPDGFVFYTNYESRKGRQLEKNNRVSLNFYWRQLALQVRIEGEASKTTRETSDAYFATRSRGSQLGAWASDQSRPLESRQQLEQQYDNYREKFEGQEVPRPEHWGGYRVEPELFEFWEAKPERLHNRWVFERDGSEEWSMHRLYP